MMNPALAAGGCATEDQAMALKTAAVQQQLMVAAFMCHDADAYNRFVQTYQGDLQRSDAVLKGYFVHRAGGHGEADYDTWKTRAANLYALDQARNDRAFCAMAGELFAAALASQAPLAAFVAASASTPDFAQVCIQNMQAIRSDAVRVADGTPVQTRK
jgi:hypothetical protein